MNGHDILVKFSTVAVLIVVGAVVFYFAPLPEQAKQVAATVAIPGVRVISSATCGSAVCNTLGVTCQGIAERQVRVREQEPSQTAKGGVIFTTGGNGKAYYSDTSANAKSIVQDAITNKFEAFEVAWNGQQGWATNSQGKGYKAALCGYELTARWIHGNRANVPSLMCSTGNSGGGHQIAYGLSVYNLKDIMDMVILTGGPDISRVDVGCFGEQVDSSLAYLEWPTGVLGRTITDYLMNWPGSCKNSNGSSAEIAAGNDTSLVPGSSSNEVRDYNYTNTRVNFVNSENDSSNAYNQGNLYYGAILGSNKAWYSIPGSVHDVPSTTNGSAKIKSLIKDECKVY